MPQKTELPLDKMVFAPLAGRTLGPPGDEFVIAESSDPGGSRGHPQLIAPLHVHHLDDEVWYVLKGTLKFRLGDREVEAPAGSAVFGPRGVPHTFWNPGPGPTRYLLIMTANTEHLLEEIHSLRDRNLETLKAVFRKYNCEILE